MANVVDASPIAAETATIKDAFRRAYGSGPGNIVSIAVVDEQGNHPYLQVLVSGKFPTGKLPRSFHRLPVLVRRTGVGVLALGS
ncbi:MAG: hypothetical protein ACYDGR_06715 [Candidatus Dormibacteria bacterium]